MSETPKKKSKDEKKKEKSYFDVDLSNGQRGVWLVKVPKYISDRWKSDAKPKQNVGKIRITKSRFGGQKPKIAFSLDSGLVEAGGSGNNERIPQEHNFVVSTLTAQTMAVFSQTKALYEPGDDESGSGIETSPASMSIEGTVVQRCECRPIMAADNVYMRVS